MLSLPLRTEIRRLRRRPLLSAAVIATAALAIAAATTLATVTRHFVLRPLPGVERPSELVNLHRALPQDEFGSFSLDEYRTLVSELGGLAGVAAFRDQGVSLAAGGEPTLAIAQLVSGNYFATLGARPAAGRLLGPDDDRPGAAAVAVLDHAHWRRGFGGDPAVVGRSVRINGQSFEIVGVAPPGFAGTLLGLRFDLFLPLAQIARADPGLDPARPELYRLELVARRRSEVPPAAAREELDRLAAAFRDADAERWRDAEFRIAATSGIEPSLERAARLFFAALGGLGALALVVVAFNLTGLLLADHLDRRHELAVRAALGGDRRRLLAPLALQSTLLFGAGGALGTAMSFALARGLRAYSAGLSFPLDLELRPDLTVLAFGIGLALALGLAVGTAAAWRISRVAPAEAIGAARGVAGPRGGSPRGLLIAIQVTGSVVLLALALLFAADARAARRTDLGLRLEHVAVVDFNVGLLGLDDAEQIRVSERTLARLAEIPGVEATAAASPFPLSFGQPTRAIGRTAAPDDAAPIAVAAISPGYFDLLALPLATGRDFSAADGAASEPVAIVNETFAAEWWPRESPLDRSLYVEGVAARVVGVARDSRSRRPWQVAQPTVYLALAQHPTPRATLAVRHRGDLGTVAAAVRAALAETVPDLGTPPLRSAGDQLATLLLPQRSAAAVASALGALSALLAAVGLYALVARQVAGARREIGVRQALGATAAAIRRQFLGRSLRSALVGVGVALPLVAGAARGLRPLLPAAGVDPFAGYLAASGLLLVVAVAASWLPAQVAARLTPAAALRQD